MKRKKRTAKTITGWAATRGRRGVIRQAASDLQRGQEDTDCRSPRTRSPDCPAPAPARKRAR